MEENRKQDNNMEENVIKKMEENMIKKWMKTGKKIKNKY